MTERLFLDANVLFTATISPKGVSAMLLRLADVDECKVITSAFAIDEVRRNIRSKYPDATKDLEAVLEQVEVVLEPSTELVRWATVFLPAKDAPILAGAVGAKVSILVTGDRSHFGQLFGTTERGVLVLEPRTALSRILSR